MKVAILADDDGYIVAMAECRMSMTGEAGSFNEYAHIEAQITRAALNASRGREAPIGDKDEIITSEIIELPDDLHGVPLGEIMDTMLFDRSGKAFRQL